MNNAALSADALEEMRRAAERILPEHTPRAVVVYGSFGRMKQNTASDVDVLFVGETSPAALEQLTSALIGYSRRRGLALDDEVPYANKLLVNWDEPAESAGCAVFTGSPRLIPVRRHPDFLGSRYMRARLLVTGVLAQQTLSWSEDPRRLDALRARAQAGLVHAAMADLESFGIPVDRTAVVEYLIGQGIAGGDWLGFESDAATRHHLHTIVAHTLHTDHPPQRVIGTSAR